jgi:hypothetical protein
MGVGREENEEAPPTETEQVTDVSETDVPVPSEKTASTGQNDMDGLLNSEPQLSGPVCLLQISEGNGRELLLYEGLIYGQRVKVLVDSGATDNLCQLKSLNC